MGEANGLVWAVFSVHNPLCSLPAADQTPEGRGVEVGGGGGWRWGGGREVRGDEEEAYGLVWSVFSVHNPLCSLSAADQTPEGRGVEVGGRTDTRTCLTSPEISWRCPCLI